MSSKVEFTHLDKLFWPEQNISKGDLVAYYQKIGDIMLQYLKDRPCNLLRQPNGYNGKSFFQKNMSALTPAWAKSVAVYSETNGKDISYFVCDSMDALLYMVQLGCIEINPWDSRVGSLDKPDWAVIDLDPEGVDFLTVVKVAKTVHSVCEELKIPSYPKTSGKTGMHIFIPMEARYTYEQVREFAETIAYLVSDRLPDITSLERNPGKRRRRVYIDYLQNRESQTLAAPYSVRPVKEASVSAPLHWDEVTAKLDPRQFTMKTIFNRLGKLGDIWSPVLKQGVDLEKILSKLSTKL